MFRVILTTLALLLAACAPVSGPSAQPKDKSPYVVPAATEALVRQGKLASAVFAGGCFWCVETAFEPLPGVVAVISGFSGGAEKEPTYEDVSSSRTGHIESVRVLYDPAKVTYERLLEVFWHNIDPTQADGQFCDRGPQYRSAVFFGGPAEKAAAERTRQAVAAKLPGPVVTELLPFTEFWPAENYHQDFYKKNPEHYRAYREGCGRDRRLRALWGEEAGH